MVHKEILRLAIPNILSNISIPLISAVDIALMGRISASYLAAIGIGAMIFNFFYWNFGFLRMGTTGMTAQAYGSNDQVSVRNTLLKSSLLALLIAVIFLSFRPFIYSISADLLHIGTDQSETVQRYFYYRSWDAPATFMLYALMGWFFGMQNAVIPLVITLVINVTNLVLSIYFVQFLGWDIKGVALGSVFAQYLGLIIACLCIFKYYRNYWPAISSIKRKSFWIFEQWSHFLSVNQDLFIRTIGLTSAFAFFYRESSTAGTVVLASNVILLQFLSWISHGIDGFAFAAESVSGKYYGRGNLKLLLKSIQLSFLFGAILAGFYAVLIGLFGLEITALFSDDPRVMLESKENMIYLVLLPMLAFICYIWDGVFIGLTWSGALRNTMIAALLLYLGVYYILDWLHFPKALWLAFLIFMLARGIFQSWVWNVKRKLLGHTIDRKPVQN